MKTDNRRKCQSLVKKALLYAALALASTGCVPGVPGETVVTVTAADVECAMTGGVARAEVVMVLTNSVPAIDPKKMHERVLKDLKLSATNSPVDVMLKVLECELIKEPFVAFMPPGDTIKFSARPDGTNVLLCAHIRQTAFFTSDTNKLATCHFQNLRLHIDENGKLGFYFDESFMNQRMWCFGLMAYVLHFVFGVDDAIEGVLLDYLRGLGDPFEAESCKVLITGEGASKFKVHGTKILHADAQIKPTLSTKL